LTPESLNKATRRAQTLMNVALLPFIPLMVFSVSIARWLADPLSSLGLHVASPALNLVLIAIWLAVLFGIIFAIQNRTWPRCPNCHRKISPGNARIVIASKHCPLCGGLVIGQGS